MLNYTNTPKNKVFLQIHGIRTAAQDIKKGPEADKFRTTKGADK